MPAPRTPSRPDEPGKKRLGKKVLAHPGALWAAAVFALLLAWYDIAFRVRTGLFYSLPLDLLSHPRRDAEWLCALAAMASTWAAVALALGSRAARSESAPPNRRLVAIVAALVCTAGTACAVFGTGLAWSAIGGAAAGAGFALLACVAIANAGSIAPEQAIVPAIGGLGGAAAVKMLCLVLSPASVQILACMLPLGTAACLAQGARAAGPGKPAAPQPAGFPAIPRILRRSHTTTVLACFLGLGAFMGIIGFGSDNLEGTRRLLYQLGSGALGSLLVCAALLLANRADPDGPFILAPTLLGTAALFLPFSGEGANLAASVLGKAADNCSFALAAVVLAQTASAPEGSAASRLRRAMATAALAAALMLGGILAGGFLASTVGFDFTSLSLVAILLVYLGMLVLGLAARRRSKAGYIVVRNPTDVARIATAQARAIAEDFPELSPREIDVLERLLQHQSIDRMAEDMGISRNTVKSHIGHLYAKTGLNARQQLIDLAATKTVEM